MIILVARAVVLTVVLACATLVFAEELVVSALILLTVGLGTVSLLLGSEDEQHVENPHTVSATRRTESTVREGTATTT